MLNTEPALSFENFMKMKNNFYLHFAGNVGDHLVGDIYSQNDAYKRCMQANPDAFDILARGLGKRTDTASDDYYRKLYQAYLMMYPYAEKNRDLFM